MIRKSCVWACKCWWQSVTDRSWRKFLLLTILTCRGQFCRAPSFNKNASISLKYRYPRMIEIQITFLGRWSVCWSMPFALIESKTSGPSRPITDRRSGQRCVEMKFSMLRAFSTLQLKIYIIISFTLRNIWVIFNNFVSTRFKKRFLFRLYEKIWRENVWKTYNKFDTDYFQNSCDLCRRNHLFL